MWEWDHVRRLMDFASDNGLNAIVFHQNDIIDEILYPERFVPRQMMKRRFPVYQFGTDNNYAYIARVAEECRARGLFFFLEVKELWFRAYLLQYRPQLMQTGALCPNDPFWFEFLEAKFETLYEKLPDVSGVIASIATKESRISIVNSQCQCEKCRATSASEWYRKIIGAMRGPTIKAGKKLVIRDFAWAPKDLDEVVSAVESSPEDVIISFKATPHDYYPDFPDNPRIGDVGNHPQWIEYDVWGQFFGWGVFPCAVVEDIRRRMKHAISKGAIGFIARTDWELVSEATALDGLASLNLQAFAQLSKDVDADAGSIYKTWLSRPVPSAFAPTGMPAPAVSTAGPDVAALRSIFERTCGIMVRGTYVLGHVFNFASTIPDDLDTAWFMMTENHSLTDWDKAAAAGLALSDENYARILAEKELALAQARDLAREFLGVKDQFCLDTRTFVGMARSFELFPVYIEGFLRATAACFAVKRVLEGFAPGPFPSAERCIDDLEDYGRQIGSIIGRTGTAHYVYMLLDAERVGNLARDLRNQLTALGDRQGA